MSPSTAMTYVLDTNVLLHDPEALSAFAGHHLVIPIDVIEEMEQFYGQASEKGHNARHFSNEIEQLSQKGSLSVGVPRAVGGTIQIFVWGGSHSPAQTGIDWRKGSNKALACAINLKKQGGAITLVSQNINVRIKASALDIPVLGYESTHTALTELYQGWQWLKTEGNLVEEILPPTADYPLNHGLIGRQKADQFAVWRNKANQWVLSGQASVAAWGIVSKNPQQQLALDLLLDPAISLVTLVGKAGTGKTLLALAAGLQTMLDESQYKKMMVSRPIFPMGKDLGYLPGTAQEKLEPWMQPIFDNLEQLISPPASRRNTSKGYEALIEQGLIQIEPLTYIRGRSIPQQFMVVDEAQNLTPHEIKTILTRAGQGTKIVFTGDPFQIDSPYLDLFSNGLTHVVERFKHHPASGHVTFIQGERSALAESAADLL